MGQKKLNIFVEKKYNFFCEEYFPQQIGIGVGIHFVKNIYPCKIQKKCLRLKIIIELLYDLLSDKGSHKNRFHCLKSNNVMIG